MRTITLHNVEITIAGETEKDAYKRLADALRSVAVDWSTDTYSNTDDIDATEKPTEDLFPIQL
jgi:hypothetical protein